MANDSDLDDFLDSLVGPGTSTQPQEIPITFQLDDGHEFTLRFKTDATDRDVRHQLEAEGLTQLEGTPVDQEFPLDSERPLIDRIPFQDVYKISTYTTPMQRQAELKLAKEVLETSKYQNGDLHTFTLLLDSYYDMVSAGKQTEGMEFDIMKRYSGLLQGFYGKYARRLLHDAMKEFLDNMLAINKIDRRGYNIMLGKMKSKEREARSSSSRSYIPGKLSSTRSDAPVVTYLNLPAQKYLLGLSFAAPYKDSATRFVNAVNRVHEGVNKDAEGVDRVGMTYQDLAEELGNMTTPVGKNVVALMDSFLGWLRVEPTLSHLFNYFIESYLLPLPAQR